MEWLTLVLLGFISMSEILNMRFRHRTRDELQSIRVQLKAMGARQSTVKNGRIIAPPPHVDTPRTTIRDTQDLPVTARMVKVKRKAVYGSQSRDRLPESE